MPDFTPYFIKAPGELLSVPFSAATDFTVLADRCETFAETLIESNDPTLKMALCGRLNDPKEALDVSGWSPFYRQCRL